MNCQTHCLRHAPRHAAATATARCRHGEQRTRVGAELPRPQTESIEGTFIKPGQRARVGGLSLRSARIELVPPGGGPHGERGATQGPHSTPVHDTKAVDRAPLLALPR